MTRFKLKNGGRHRALFGADGAISAAATLAAAGITAAATASAAKTQAKAVEANAKTQAQSIKEQTLNNNALQKESIAFSKQQNQENRQQQQDIQTTLQMLAGQSNLNSRLEANKVAVKYGGRHKNKLSIRTNTQQPFYGGASQPFIVTDGGGAVPVQTDMLGYGLYELYGNDHEHYHKTRNGKHKSGVGIQFPDGSVIEGEGNQNTDNGELLYVTPDDAMFISKHSIKGFNPAKAVKQGVHPVQAFEIQESIKAQHGLTDDGKQKPKAQLGKGILTTTDFMKIPVLNAAPVAAGVVHLINKDKTSTPVAKNGTHISLSGTTPLRNNYSGAIYNAAGNVLGAGITTLGNMFAARSLGRAYSNAGAILADAYDRMKGIDLSELSREDYNPGHAMAAISSAYTNINPQLERLRRNSNEERRIVNNNTLSSAVRQQRLSAINDRMYQRAGEQYAYKDNLDNQIRQQNNQTITDVSKVNAELDSKARGDYGNQRLALLQYNNNIENSKIAGKAQGLADAQIQTATANANAFQTSLNAFGSALASAGQGFAAAYDANRKEKIDFNNTYAGLGDASQVKAAILRAEQTGDTSYVKALMSQYANKEDNVSKSHYKSLVDWVNKRSIKRNR